MAARPHVSAAIVQLRWWISAAAGLLCVCLAAQLLIFGFVHYTDVRWTEIKPAAKDRPLVIVDSERPAVAGPVRVPAQEARARALREAQMRESAPGKFDGDINRVLTGTDRVMRVASDLATTAGVVAVVSLVILTFLGVAVAGGGGIPGVERAVTACAWSCVLALLCLPLRDLLPTLPFPGILSGYDGLTSASDSANAKLRGEGGVLGLYVLLPAVAIAGAVMVRLWFNDGVERGIIYTSVSEIDEAMDKEMAAISARGVQAGVPRAMGALHRAMGDAPALSEPTPAVMRIAAGAETMSEPAPAPRRPSPKLAVDPEDFKRPI